MRSSPLLGLVGLRGLVAVAAALGGLGGCAREGAAPAVAPALPPLEVVVGAPEPPPPTPPTIASAPARAPEPDPEPEPAALPRTWTEPIVPGLAFADAVRNARAARDAFERLAAPTSTTTANASVQKAWFTRAQLLADQASRMYAGAFHAADAPREGRIEAIAEAAELDMTMARTLDEQNLGTMPATWRSDPAVAGTFEDVDVGPTRRWRNEARVLARQCIDTAKESSVATDAARRCAALRTGAIPKRAKQATDTPAGCACSPGDPLCSASLGGWCGAH